jgi:hypothetical protein
MSFKLGDSCLRQRTRAFGSALQLGPHPRECADTQCRATNSSQSSLAVGENLEYCNRARSNPGCGNYGKLCAKNAASFPQLPQPLLLLKRNKRKGKNKTLLLEKGLDIHIAVDRTALKSKFE